MFTEYQLTDGHEIFGTAWFTPWEAKKADEQASEPRTDESVWWEPTEETSKHL